VTLLAGALTPQVQCPLIRMRFPPECTTIYPSNPCPWRTHLISGPAVRRRDPTCGSLDAPSNPCPWRTPTPPLSRPHILVGWVVRDDGAHVQGGTHCDGVQNSRFWNDVFVIAAEEQVPKQLASATCRASREHGGKPLPRKFNFLE